MSEYQGDSTRNGLEPFPAEMEYVPQRDPKALVIQELLESHGEVILHTASGQVLELHLGDDYALDDHFLTVGLTDREIYIAYDQIESLTCHVAHLE